MTTLHQLKYGKDRKRTQAMYNAKLWRRTSARYRANNPLCVQCKANGKTVPSQVTDHIVPHRGDWALFWDEDNFQALCKRCHNKKSRGEQ